LKLTEKKKMGRPGVIYQDVAMAAEQLATQGRNPTIESVRALLGTGSTATVGPYLRAWRNKQDASRHLALKEKLPEELIAVIKGLWERVFVDAEAKFETERVEMRQSSVEYQKQLESLQTEYNLAQQKISALTEEKNVSMNDKKSIEESISRQAESIREMTAEKNSFAIRIETQQTRIDELHQLHGQVQKNLEHYREASLEQRRQDQQAYEQQRHQQEQISQQLRHEAGQLQHQLAVAQQQFISQQKETARLDEFVKQLKQSQEVADKMLVGKSEELVRQTHACENWQQQYEQLNTRAKQNEKSAKDAELQLAVVTQKLAITEASLREVTAQNRLLVKDKWILEQERAAQ